MVRAVEVIPVSNHENIERVLLNPELFVRAIPGASLVSEKELIIRIPLKLIFIKMSDEYKLTFYSDRSGYSYELKGLRGYLLFHFSLKGEGLEISVVYDGLFKSLIGLRFREFAEELAKNLEQLISELPKSAERRVTEGIFEVNFDDPEDFKRKLYGFLLLRTEEFFVSEDTLPGLLPHIVGEENGIFYISGISPDGRKRFQLVLQDGKPTSVRYLEEGKLRIARLSLNPREIERVMRLVSGDFIINIWKKVGRVSDGN